MADDIIDGVHNADNVVDDEVKNSVADEPVLSKEDMAKARKEALKNIDDRARWYALHVYSGYEQVVQDNLNLVIEKYNLQDRIFEIVIPMEDVIEEKNGKRKLVSRKMFPGYVLVKMIYGDDIWHAITRTRGVTAFCGAKGRAEPMTDEEVAKLRLDTVKVEVDLKAGDKIEITDGPLSAMVGEIISIDLQNQKCKANVNMFGRDMPIDLDFYQVRKI